ncbi:hypothetical protein OAT84_02465 [Gammaproteobacteria bacterium]|nr:hypothetical protein [Gammaproteobacteria bacterium]
MLRSGTRFSSKDMMNPEETKALFLDVPINTPKEGDIIIVRFGVTPQQPEGTSGHVYIHTPQGWLSLIRNLPKMKDGILIEAPLDYKMSSQKHRASFDSLSHPKKY